MKVIQKGPIQKFAKEVICTGNPPGSGGCRAKLLVEGADLYVTHTTYHEFLVTFRCCECGTEKAIDTKNHPHISIDLLPSRKAWATKNNLLSLMY